ncbi:ABC transporter ATP-binding protein [Arcanobacterium pinnipediorum]|uniref:ABC transporter ATP-binding protein/permease n=1 Tax=Arcanobacterium pinnipediorum TaxID=1503041 RepID=A0ABY5AIQ5_9ACTO|nr:ABC transporter ATP-binding protein [Arcanobacterium pinnipediorum]USR80073.1 ABC transporter ATP-binding protein/permease [Arcanobacterium pinnipediorum]
MAQRGSLDDTTRDMKGSLLRLAQLFRPERLRIIGVVILTLVGTLAMLLTPKLLGDATNIVVDGVSHDGVNFTALAHLALVIIGLYAMHAVANVTGGALARIAVQNLGSRLRRDAQEKIDRLPLAYVDRQARGDLLSRVTNDIDNIVQTLMQTLGQTIYAIYMVIGVLSMMFYLSWTLALWSLFVVPIGMVVVARILKRSKPAFREQWKRTGDVSTIVEQTFTGHDVVLAYGMESDINESFDRANEKLFRAGFRGFFLSMLAQPIMGLVSNLSFVVIAVVGGFQVLNGTLSIGGIQAFIQYSRQLNNPVAMIASVANMLQSSAASSERLFDFLDTPDIPADSDNQLQPFSGDGTIIFRDVEFGYEPGKTVIKGLNLTIERGSQIAIVGPTGAGKTTLVNLLMRFYDIDSGSIRIDDVDIRDYSRRSLRSRTGMVLQDTWLFDGTIEENIAFGAQGAQHDDVVAAAQATGVDHLIRQLPDGYLTHIDDEDGNLSSGEKQLITIARAYLSDPDILILDEATSSVDTRTEMLVQRAMGELRAGRTSFVIAHRLSTIRDADLILVMVDGNVVEQGNHSELMAAGGAYYDLYQAQFTGSQED